MTQDLCGAFLKETFGTPLLQLHLSLYSQQKQIIFFLFLSPKIYIRKEHRLRVFENRVLRRIFGSKRDEVTGSWRKLYNEELHNMCSSPSIIRMIKSRRMRWAGHVARIGEKRNVYTI
jgi:hypothetical protein